MTERILNLNNNVGTTCTNSQGEIITTLSPNTTQLLELSRSGNNSKPLQLTPYRVLLLPHFDMNEFFVFVDDDKVRGKRRRHQPTSIRVKFSSPANDPHLPNLQLARRMETIWEDKLKQNPRLFNGKKFRLARITMEEEDDVAELHVGLTDYKTHVQCSTTTREGVEIVQLLKEEGKRLACGDETALLPLCFGNAGGVVTHDGYLVFIRRSSHVNEFASYFDLPGGHPEPDSCGEALNEETVAREILSRSIVDEICDEIGLEREVDLKSRCDGDTTTTCCSRLVGIIATPSLNEKPAAVFLLRASDGVTASVLSKRYASGPKEAFESTRIAFIHVSSIRERKGRIWGAQEIDSSEAQAEQQQQHHHTTMMMMTDVKFTPNASFLIDLLSNVI